VDCPCPACQHPSRQLDLCRLLRCREADQTRQNRTRGYDNSPDEPPWPRCGARPPGRVGGPPPLASRPGRDRGQSGIHRRRAPASAPPPTGGLRCPPAPLAGCPGGGVPTAGRAIGPCRPGDLLRGQRIGPAGAQPCGRARGARPRHPGRPAARGPHVGYVGYVGYTSGTSGTAIIAARSAWTQGDWGRAVGIAEATRGHGARRLAAAMREEMAMPRGVRAPDASQAGCQRVWSPCARCQRAGSPCARCQRVWSGGPRRPAPGDELPAVDAGGLHGAHA